MEVIEKTGTALTKEIDSDVIEFDISNDSVNFDGIILRGSGWLMIANQRWILWWTRLGTIRRGMDLKVVISLNEMKFFPGIGRSKRRTVGIPPDGLGFEMTHIVTDPINGNEVLVNYEEAVNRKDSATWKRPMKLAKDLLNKLNMLKLVRLSPGQKVVQTRCVFDAKRGDGMIV